MAEAIEDFNKWPVGHLLYVKSFGINVSAGYVESLHECFKMKNSEEIENDLKKEPFCVHYISLGRYYFQGRVYSEKDIVSGEYIKKQLLFLTQKQFGI